MKGTEKKFGWPVAQTYLTGNWPCEQRLLLSSRERKQKKGSSSRMEGAAKKYDWVTCGSDIQSTPDKSNLQGKPKKSSSYRELKENSRE